MLRPGGTIGEIASERLLAPRHLAWRDNRRERRYAAEAIRMIECDGECPVAAHRMAGDRLSAHVDRKLGRDECRELVDHIGPHAVVRCPGVLRCIDVEACALAEVPLV